jgi:hypothetical protein
MFNINILYKNSKKYQWNVNSYIKYPGILTNHYSANGYFACQNSGSQIIAGQYASAYCEGYLPSRYKLQSILTQKNNNKISYPIFQVLKKVKYRRSYLTTWELDLRSPYKSKKDKKWYKKRNKIIEFKLKYVERKQKRFQKRFNSILKLYQFQFLLSQLLNHNYSIRGFFWQSKKFLRYFLIHPYLLQKVIQLLNFSSFLRLRNSKIISKKKIINNQKNFSISSVYANSYSQNQILFLTQFWIIFFDYFYLVSQKQSKWKGIRILLSGRLGLKKMGRAKKYLRYWGTTKMSQAIFPLQYTYSQIRGRYGVVGMKIAIH